MDALTGGLQREELVMRGSMIVLAALGVFGLSSGVAAAQAARGAAPMDTMGSSNGMLNNDSSRQEMFGASTRANTAQGDSFYSGSTSSLSKADKKLLKRCNGLSQDAAAKDDDCQALLARAKADKGPGGF
jgi:hypothetical protein